MNYKQTLMNQLLIVDVDAHFNMLSKVLEENKAPHLAFRRVSYVLFFGYGNFRSIAP